MTDRELPVLRIVPADSLILHEGCEDRRIQRLKHLIAKDGFLKNPPIVAPLPSRTEREYYVVLDGANRVSALQELRCPHILVQVVHYDEVGLDTWNHLVTGIDKDEFFAALQAIRGLTMRLTDIISARDRLAARRILAYIVCLDGDVHTLSGGESLQEQAVLLNQVVDLYKRPARIYRLKTDDIEQQREYYDDIAALVVFPAFSPADIVTLAVNHAKLPTGITRHIIPSRALRTNVPLSVLAEDKPAEAKNAWLHDTIRAKLNQKEIRYYQESTFLFDE
ncbi:MAG: ParB N-terminal domain-containing protein [Chloroflexi bacterium]|nr:ParB N-terminal domain-containing protein [Chloroflexota bacterium]